MSAQFGSWRCIIIKSSPEEDLYVGWSNITDDVLWYASREDALAGGVKEDRLTYADKTGTSSRLGEGKWTSKGFTTRYESPETDTYIDGWLPRDKIGAYAAAACNEDAEAIRTILEPYDDEEEG